MDSFVDTFPWRLASAAGLIVGIVGFAYGGVDVWTDLERVGIAFAAFFVLGAFARTLLYVGGGARGRRVGRAQPVRDAGSGIDSTKAP